MANTYRDDSGDADSVIVIEPEDILPADQTDVRHDLTGDQPDDLGGGPSEDGVGWDNAAHWHRAVPGTDRAVPGTDLGAEPDSGLEPAADLGREPEPEPEPEPDQDSEDDLGRRADPVPAAWSVPGPELVRAPDVEPVPVAAAGASPSPSWNPTSGLTAPASGRDRWREILSGFVDDPRASVTDAAALADEEVAAWTGRLRQRQEALREGWQDVASPGTEEYRLALKAYRDLSRQLDAVTSALA